MASPLAGAMPTSSANLQPTSDAGRANGRITSSDPAARGGGRQRQYAPDEAMDMDEIEGEDGEGDGPRRRRGKKNLRPAEDIPRVRDETGERVREAFEAFVETCVRPSQPSADRAASPTSSTAHKMM